MHSLYIHIPFCRQACHYCDFHFSTTLKRKEQMVSALCQELVLRKQEAQGSELQTIYFGGGTPSLLSYTQLQLIFQTIYAHYKVFSTAEITLEANPDDFSQEQNQSLSLQQLSSLGINRLSLGIQSFFDEDLRLINRAHNAVQAEKILEKSLQFFKNISIDLIYGIPGLDNDRWLSNVQKAIDYQVPHISAYALTLEPKTALETLIKKGNIPKLNEQQAHEQFFLLKNILEKEGYEHYELSNFGKKGFFSRNNTAYWEQKKYMGIGPSAHSYNAIERSWNISNNIKYIQQIQHNIRPYQSEKLSIFDRYNELIMTGLRTKKGVSLLQVESDFGPQFLAFLKKESLPYIQKGMLFIENHHLKVSDEGLFLSDGIASDLFYCNSDK